MQAPSKKKNAPLFGAGVPLRGHEKAQTKSSDYRPILSRRQGGCSQTPRHSAASRVRHGKQKNFFWRMWSLWYMRLQPANMLPQSHGQSICSCLWKPAQKTGKNLVPAESVTNSSAGANFSRNSVPSLELCFVSHCKFRLSRFFPFIQTGDNFRECRLNKGCFVSAI